VSATTLTMSELLSSGARELGTSGWTEVDQHQIDLFAEATHDHQWIHVDPEMAAQGPFGTTVAHGYLTLSLLPALVSEVLVISDRVMGINYGSDRIRFTSPVPVGSRVRLHAKLLSSEQRGPGVLSRIGVQIEIEGENKPALVGETLFLSYGDPSA
jgi:acyl dehydratase